MAKKEKKAEGLHMSAGGMIIIVIIVLMIVAIIFTGAPTILGFMDFTRDIGKEKIENDDGTYSIPQDAPVKQNADNKYTYIGKVLNQTIQFGKDDFFNRQLQYIYSMQLDPYTKYYYARQTFNSAINRIIGIKIAEDLNFVVSKNLLTNKVGKQYYSDSSGDIDYTAISKDNARFNSLANEYRSDMLYENFTFDFFNGMPVSRDEMLNKYKLENTKVTLKYVNISNDVVNDGVLKTFYEANKSDYKMYKLSKMIFNDKKEAETNLAELKKNPKKFDEIGKNLKSTQKIYNLINETEYALLADLENEDYRSIVKSTSVGNVGSAVIQSSQGPVIVKVVDIMDGDFSDEKVKSQVKNDYMIKNIKEIDAGNKKIADEIYNDSKSNGLDKAASKFEYTAQTTSPVEFLGSGIPYVNSDTTDDRNFEMNVFKASKGDVLPPFKHSDGYLVVSIDDRTEASLEDFENTYDSLMQKYSSAKSDELESDFYRNIRKKYEIINNFDYVITPQSFVTDTAEE